MSLARAALRTHAKPPSAAIVQRRLASDHAHHDEHHHHDADTTVYPKEGFGKGTAYLVLAGLSAVGWYKFAPGQGEESALTRWIAGQAQPAELWQQRNEQHLALSAQNAEELDLIRDAKLPSMYRLRHPQAIGQCSPHGRHVGHTYNVDDVRVKQERE